MTFLGGGFFGVVFLGGDFFGMVTFWMVTFGW